MAEIKLTKRYPNSRTEDITDAYMRGWNDALDAVQNGKFHIADTPQTDLVKDSDDLVKDLVKDAPQTEQTEPKQGTDCTEVEPTTEDCSMVDCKYYKNPDYQRCMECKKKQTDCGWGKPNERVDC